MYKKGRWTDRGDVIFKYTNLMVGCHFCFVTWTRKASLAYSTASVGLYVECMQQILYLGV